MITENLSTLKIHKLTQAQYDRELAAGNIDENALYLTPDEEIDLSKYATKEELNTKSNADHNHDDVYYTEVEVDTLLSNKANTNHNHDTAYDTKGSADTALASAKSYTDTKTSSLASTTVVDNKISTHNTSTSAHNDIRNLISGLTTRLNTLADSDDTTLDQMSEIVEYIKSNKTLIDSVTTSKVNVSDIVNNLTTNVTNKPLSAAQGVTIKNLIDTLQNEVDSHTHAIADITNLQTTLDGKAAASHGTHVTFDSTNKPKMDGTAAFGTSTNVARADHVHPVDTSRASQVDLDALETVVAGKANASHTHTIANITDLQTTLDGKASSSHSHSAATTSASGFMSASDKSKLDGISSSADSVSFSRNLTSGTKVGTITINGTGTDLYAPTNTDTHYTSKNVVGSTSATSNTTSALSNGSVYLNSVENGAVTSTHKISGSGATTVTTDTSGNIIISSTDNNTTYSAAGSSLGLVKSGGDVTISSGVITVNDDSHNHTIDNIDSLQETLDGKSNISHTHDEYMTTTNPTGTGSFSMNRKNGSTVGDNSSALGQNCEASGHASHAEGYRTTASNYDSHAEGYQTTASGYASHAEGYQTTASGLYGSHAEGYNTTASGYNSHAEGCYTTALDYQHAQGHYNNQTNAKDGVSSGTGTGTAFVIGNGTESAGANAFRVNYDGKPYAKSSIATTGCDYAEYFEWEDLNPNNEDRRGYFVTLNEDKIKIAESNDYILGIISGQPSVIGNGDEDWLGRYVFDDFGAFVYEDFEYEVEISEEATNEETGEVTTEKKTVIKTGKKYKENPDYDKTREYIQREDRPEWDAVGLLGVLSVRDDGTCEVNGYCKVSNGGIATASEVGYRVIKRVNDNIVKVVFR